MCCSPMHVSPSCCLRTSPALPPHLAQEHLSLEANALCALPPALTLLPRLRYLDLSSNLLAW